MQNVVGKMRVMPDANELAQSYFDALMRSHPIEEGSNTTGNVTMLMEQLEQKITAVLRELDKSLSDGQQTAALLSTQLQRYQSIQYKIQDSLSVNFISRFHY